jgi:hypothetical protein
MWRISMILMLLLWGDALAAAPRSAAIRPAKRGTVAKVVAKAAAKDSTRKATTKAAGREAPRTLQDIHIEGEIPVPQVLFITARDQRRFLDCNHHRYLGTARQVGERTVLPSWIGVTSPPPADARKENPR